MTQANSRIVRWMGMTAVALAVTACGGGGDDSGTGSGGVQPTNPVADARNGTYNMYAADGREYALALDFDAKTYRVTGGTTDQSGSFAAQGDDFAFQPGNAASATGFNTARFRLATDTVVGEFNLAQSTVPFVAPRNYVSTLAAAVGVYNFLGRRIDVATSAGTDTSIQQGEITSGGTIRTCDDAAVLRIADCPNTSVTTSPLTLSGNVFTATVTGQGTYNFRVAQVGTDKVFVRADTSSSGTRRFLVGTPATAAFTAGTFAGGSTDPAWGSFALTNVSFTSNGTTPAGTTLTRNGSISAVAVPDIRLINASTQGLLYAARSSEIAIVVGARNNAAATGFVAIGKAQ